MNMAVTVDFEVDHELMDDFAAERPEDGGKAINTKESLLKRLQIDKILQERQLQRTLRDLDFDYDLDD